MWAGSYYLLRYYILFCTKPANLTAGGVAFSIDFNDVITLDAVPKPHAARAGGGQETIIILTSHGLKYIYIPLPPVVQRSSIVLALLVVCIV